MTECLIDRNFQPMYLLFRRYREAVSQAADKNDFIVVVERTHGYNERFKAEVFVDEAPEASQNPFFCERLVKTLLWIHGGYRLWIHASKPLFEQLQAAYSKGGSRDFDVRFMERVYGAPFEVIHVPDIEDLPASRPQKILAEGSLEGARIGFDAGGSDRKVAAVLDGEVLYSEEVVWHPKQKSDPDYHIGHIRGAIMLAKSKLPRVDRLGVSSAGIYVDNEAKVASLFLKIPQDDYDRVRTVYIDIGKELGVPLKVANDGDVAALAGALELGKNNLLGIAMGTSEAAGYIDGEGALRGWLNELAFVPVDASPNAMEDEWSTDIGVGVKYHSQDGIIKLAQMAGIRFEDHLSPAERLKVVQSRIENDDDTARRIFEDAGVYFAYSLMYYRLFYSMDDVLLMGRVVSGKGGETLVETARRILDEHQIDVTIHLPDEKSRRVGQAVAAASL